ncbi:hypothetical protein ACFL08_05825 [Patescibacteria group bacterium]
MKKSILAVIFVLLVTGTAMATTYEGPVVTMRLQEINGVTRSSVFLGASYTACSTSDWFAYDDSDTGIGKLWTAIISIAYAQGNDIRIVGNGVCDQYGVEGISYIDVY